MKTIETMGDLETELKVIGLPMSIRYIAKAWNASIEWSYPDFSTARASGRGATTRNKLRKRGVRPSNLSPIVLDILREIQAGGRREAKQLAALKVEIQRRRFGDD